MAHQSLALKDFNYVVVLGIRYSSPTALLANADLEIEILQQPILSILVHLPAAAPPLAKEDIVSIFCVSQVL